MRSALLTLVLAGLLTACHEQSSLVGPPVPDAVSAAVVTGDDPIDDALTRIVPAFGDDQAVAGLEAALLRVKNNETAAQALAEQYLARLERLNPTLTADADAIRLALYATR